MHGVQIIQKPNFKPVTLSRRRVVRGKSMIKENTEIENTTILRSLLKKLNMQPQTNKIPSPVKRHTTFQPCIIYGKKPLRPKKMSVSHRPSSKKEQPVECFKDVKMEKALIDYSDIKDSFYNDKRANQKYMKRNVNFTI